MYQQGDREPTIRYQSGQQSDAENERSDMQSQRNRSNMQTQREASEQQSGRDWVGEAQRMTADESERESATTGSGSEAQSSWLTVAQLTDMDIYNARGENLGSIDDVVMGTDSGRAYVVLAHGGFLGMFQDEVALPISRLRLRGDRLIVSGLTADEISDMPNWESRVTQPRQLDDSRTIEVRQ